MIPETCHLSKLPLMGAPELLAPAGSQEALLAALQAGANAVYLGVESFNARRGASNFTLEELKETCHYAHLAGASVYLTLNTVILPGELDDAMETARQAWYAGADALIVADVGLLTTLAQEQAQICLHASTQVGVRSPDAVSLLGELGCSRVTLARELSLSEIAACAAAGVAAGVEIEVFAHGALCFSFSGACLLSSLVGCRSANRGLCAQPCRLAYELIDTSTGRNVARGGAHPLSTRDLCTLEELPALLAAGVSSLKIEGRMRKAGYVYETVQAYRTALCALCVDTGEKAGYATASGANAARANAAGASGGTGGTAGAPGGTGGTAAAETFASAESTKTVSLSSQRGFTASYLHGKSNDELMDYARNGASRPPDTAGEWSLARVFAGNSGLVPVHFDVQAQCNAPLQLQVSVAALGCHESATVAVKGPVLTQARSRALSEADLKEHLGRIGGTPFTAARWNITLDEGLGCSFGALHQLKDAALAALKTQLLAPWALRCLPATEHAAELVPHAPEKPRLAVLVATEAQARIAVKQGASCVYYHTVALDAHSEPLTPRAAARLGVPAVPMLPVLNGTLAPHCCAGTTAVVNNFAELALRRSQEQERGREHEHEHEHEKEQRRGQAFIVGPGIHCTNAASLAALARLGAERVWLGAELSYNELLELASGSPVALSLTISGAQEVMTSKHCVFMVEGPCNMACGTCSRRKATRQLKDRKGYRFAVRTNNEGVSHVYNAVSLDLVGQLPELMAAGIGEFVVDSTLLNSETLANEVKRAARALTLAINGTGRLPKLEGRTTGHYFRGVR